MSGSVQPKFSDDQRLKLKCLDLIDAQIAEVEKKLPLARALLSKSARLQEVRDELKSLDDAIRRTRKRLTRLSRAGSGADYLRETWARVIDADDRDVIPQASGFLRKLNAVSKLALRRLPREQRRHKLASLGPVRCIDDALLSGFVKGQKKGGPLLRYTLCMSSSPGSAYRNIIGICYDAMCCNTDPERAIKAYIAWRCATTQAGRARVGLKLPLRKR